MRKSKVAIESAHRRQSLRPPPRPAITSRAARCSLLAAPSPSQAVPQPPLLRRAAWCRGRHAILRPSAAHLVPATAAAPPLVESSRRLCQQPPRPVDGATATATAAALSLTAAFSSSWSLPLSRCSLLPLLPHGEEGRGRGRRCR
uniref:Uncharacterized protein n=1 Tax=Oryza rufipogon TaxID=4529 RepID=A0A0E0PYA5_ORYRU